MYRGFVESKSVPPKIQSKPQLVQSQRPVITTCEEESTFTKVNDAFVVKTYATLPPNHNKEEDECGAGTFLATATATLQAVPVPSEVLQMCKSSTEHGANQHQQHRGRVIVRITSPYSGVVGGGTIGPRVSTSTGVMDNSWISATIEDVLNDCEEGFRWEELVLHGGENNATTVEATFILQIEITLLQHNSPANFDAAMALCCESMKRIAIPSSSLNQGTGVAKVGIVRNQDCVPVASTWLSVGKETKSPSQVVSTIIRSKSKGVIQVVTYPPPQSKIHVAITPLIVRECIRRTVEDLSV
eukprot:PhF_6_TR33551/c0_g1_i2/m.48928